MLEADFRWTALEVNEGPTVLLRTAEGVLQPGIAGVILRQQWQGNRNQQD